MQLWFTFASVCIGIVLGIVLGYALSNGLAHRLIANVAQLEDMPTPMKAPKSIDLRGRLISFDADTKRAVLSVVSPYSRHDALVLSVSVDDATVLYPSDILESIGEGKKVKARVARSSGTLRAFAVTLFAQ